MTDPRTFVAFAGYRLIGSGDIQTTLRAAKHYLDQSDDPSILVFEEQTGNQIDFDWRGTVDDVLARLIEHPAFAVSSVDEKARVGPGRPKLGVVCREISLLPRHWEWLEAQPGGISATLRRLVEEARKAHPERERARRIRDATAKIMWAVAGDLPDFEEASRALFAADGARFLDCVRDWPNDVRSHLTDLARPAFEGGRIGAD
jgi:hypothetical protein